MEYQKNLWFLKLLVNCDFFLRKAYKQEVIESSLYKNKGENKKINIESSNDISKLR